MKGIGLFCFVRAEITSEDQSLIQLVLYDYNANKMVFPFLIQKHAIDGISFFIQIQSKLHFLYLKKQTRDGISDSNL